MDAKRSVILILACAILLSAAFAPALASDRTGPLIVAQQFVDGINKGDAKMVAAACAATASIVDDFPPHFWQGPTACSDWYAAFVASNNQSGDTDPVVALGKPWHADVTGDVAYVVVPASFTYKHHGKPTVETGDVWTVALHKTAAGWRIVGWAWASH